MKTTEINLFLLKKDITKSALALDVGVNPSTIGLLFSGRVSVSEELLNKIAARLGISRKKLDGMLARAKAAQRAAEDASS